MSAQVTHRLHFRYHFFNKATWKNIPVLKSLSKIYDRTICIGLKLSGSLNPVIVVFYCFEGLNAAPTCPSALKNR